MNHNSNTLSQTRNGLLFYCNNCKIYHLTFGHFYLELTERELHCFGSYIDELDAEYWERSLCNKSIKRKIPIPTQQTNLCLLLNRTELEELKRLVFYEEALEPVDMIRFNEVDYDFIQN